VKTQTDGGRVMALIARLEPLSQKRVWVIAETLRSLVASGEEAELAFTLVMAELADDGFTLQRSSKP
jgi:hypothetical protein